MPSGVTDRAAPLLAFNRVSKVYGRGEARVQALADADFQVRRGDFLAITGPSGSGKSTCMHILGCLDAPSAGDYSFGGVSVGQLSNNQRALLRRHYLGFVFQGFNLLKRTTALENVELPLTYQGVRAGERRRRALAALEAVGLAERARHHPAQLSGGQQQRVAIARALVTEPALFLADEPTGNLDTVSSHELVGLLADLNQARGITIVMVTHDGQMAAYAKRIIRVVDGHIESDRRQDIAKGGRGS